MKLEKLKLTQPKPRNFVIKHMRGISGAGRHEDKTGPKAKRAKQKEQLRREIQDMHESATSTDRLLNLIKRLSDVSLSDAPPEMSNEEASAWASGVSWALEQVHKEIVGK